MALNTSDPKFQKAALIVLLVLGACYAYFNYIFQPRREAAGKTDSEVSRVEQSLATARAVVQAADTLALRLELTRRETELQDVEQLLPAGEDLAELLGTVTRIGENAGVKFALFEPKAPLQHELYQERPFSIKLRGGYHQTARFLADVASLPQIVKPVGLSLVRDKKEGGEPDETLTAQLTLTTYLMIPGPPPGKAPAAGKGQKVKK